MLHIAQTDSIVSPFLTPVFLYHLATSATNK